MSPPPPRPDDDPPPPASGWEVVEPARDPLLDDPLFAELVEDKPLPELKVEPPTALPIAEPVDDIPVAEVAVDPRANPADRPRPRPVTPPPPRPAEEPVEAPRPRVFVACSVLGCLGLGFVAAMGFIGWAALTLLSGFADGRRGDSVVNAGARPGPVEPTKYAAESGQIEFAGTVDAVGRAAAGRYLLLRTSRTGEVHVFDPNVGALTGKFDIGSGRSLFAGSASKLFVYRADEAGGTLERWDLETRVKEHSVKRGADVLPPTVLAVAAGTDGPLYWVNSPLNAPATIRVFDADTLTERAAYPAPKTLGFDVRDVRTSDDGATWTATTAAGAGILRFPNPQAVPALSLFGEGGAVPKFATPARDGGLVFTPVGLYDTNASPRPGPKVLTIPTAHGSDLFLTQGKRAVADGLTADLWLHPTAAPKDAVALSSVTGPRGTQADDAWAVTPDQRVHLWPAAGLAAVVTTGTPTRLRLTKLEVKDVLARLAETYVVIGSDPPRWARLGAEWRYRPTIWTNGEAAPAVTLTDGPRGMQVRPNGEVVWTPATGTERTAAVRLRATVGNVFTEQRFRVTVLDDPDGDDD